MLMKKNVIIAIVISIIVILVLVLLIILLGDRNNEYTLWEEDGIILMQDQSEGSYRCFGCGETLCIDPSPEMVLVTETPERYCDDNFDLVEDGVIVVPDENEDPSNMEDGGNEQQEANYANLQEYYESIDYSCNTDSDCEINDVRNCCGYFPKCTNVNTITDPVFVDDRCEVEQVGGVCGFPSINGCACVNNLCEGFQENPGSTGY